MPSDSKRKYKAMLKHKNTNLLKSQGIEYESKNNGYHLVVKCNHSVTFDCWPSSDKWAKRGKKSKQDFNNLIKEIERYGVKQNGCLTCSQYPYLADTGMCGTCTFGEAQAQLDLINGEMEGAVYE